MKHVCLVGLLLVLGCGDDDVPRDGGIDTGVDAGADAGADAAADGGADAGRDATTDAADDAAADDAAADVGDDAGPNTVACGDTICTLPGEICCRSASGDSSCAADCEASEIAFACDGPEDCAGQDCCRDVLSGEGGAVCADTCEGAFVPACHPPDMCDDGSLCCPMGVCLGGGCD